MAHTGSARRSIEKAAGASVLRDARATTLPAFDERLRYPIPTAARFLGVSQSHLWSRIARGELPVLKDGHRTFIAGRTIAALCGHSAA